MLCRGLRLRRPAFRVGVIRSIHCDLDSSHRPCGSQRRKCRNLRSAHPHLPAIHARPGMRLRKTLPLSELSKLLYRMAPPKPTSPKRLARKAATKSVRDSLKQDWKAAAEFMLRYEPERLLQRPSSIAALERDARETLTHAAQRQPFALHSVVGAVDCALNF